MLTVELVIDPPLKKARPVRHPLPVRRANANQIRAAKLAVKFAEDREKIPGWMEEEIVDTSSNVDPIVDQIRITEDS
jgi:hypothetical protein